VALPEFLAKYSLHGANLFQTNATGTAHGIIEHRMAMRAALLAEISAWLERNVRDVASRDLRAYLKQWIKAQELDSFELHKPGRWRYFRHLFEFPRIYAEIMSRRHRAYTYVRAFSALVLGYDHLYLLETLRTRYKGFFRRSFGGSLASEERKEVAMDS
jgi:hypothetical protein